MLEVYLNQSRKRAELEQLRIVIQATKITYQQKVKFIQQKLFKALKHP